jgi:molybdopterin-guanine dinucleotide biosynthesis protein A
VRVNFNQTHDDPKAFYNANTLADLQQLSAYEKH